MHAAWVSEQRWFLGSWLRLERLGGCMDRGANTGIGSAAANVAAHRGVDVSVSRRCIFFKQCGGGHDLAGLAVAALRYLQRDPGGLYRFRGLALEALNSSDLSPCHPRQGHDTRAYRLAIEVHRTRTAQGHAAAKFGSSQARELAHGPQQRHVGIDIQGYGFAVKNE